MTDHSLEMRSENLLLRPLTEQDATERYVGWLNDAEVNRFLEVRWHHQSLADVRSYVAGHDNVGQFVFGVFAEPDELHVGNFSIKVDENHRSAVMGVMVGDRDYWGQGIVLEARARLLDFIFSRLPVDKVSGGCYQTNVHAIFNYKRQGWELDGIRRADRLDQGRRVDVINFAMFREAWLDRNDP